MSHPYKRRLAAAALALSVPLIPACGASPPTTAQDAAHTTTETARHTSAESGANGTTLDVSKELRALERKFDARLGVYALNTGTGEQIAHRADQRFAYCSTFKSLLAGMLLKTHSSEARERVITYTADDLVEHSPVTEQHLDEGMTLRALADAAVRQSDNTAANLLLAEAFDGPEGFQDALRAHLRDEVTRSDRYEPGLSDGVPGDPRDTSTARTLAADLQKLLLGEVLNKRDRALLTHWMRTNVTGDNLIRAGVPASWKVADKSGSGGYGTRNNIAVVWPDEGAPIVLSVLSTKDRKDAERQDELIAETAELVADTLG